MKDEKRLNWLGRMIAASMSADPSKAEQANKSGEAFGCKMQQLVDEGRVPEAALREAIDHAAAAEQENR